MRRRELEAAARRRQAEIEHYRQLKEEEERQRRYEAMRRLQQQQQRQEEDYVRRQKEANRRRQREEELLRQQLMGVGGRRPAMQYPEGTVLRGPDGRLYRIVRDQQPDMDFNESSKIPDLEEPTSAAKAVRVPVSSEKQSDDTKQKDVSPAVARKNAVKKTKKPRRKKVTITVEDASDSECEEENTNSVWRNRRPSPGEWLEPVEGSL